jgi:hypothetical protein
MLFHQDEMMENVQQVCRSICVGLVYTFLVFVDANEFHFFTDASARMEASVSVLFIVLCMLLMVSYR